MRLDTGDRRDGNRRCCQGLVGLYLPHRPAHPHDHQFAVLEIQLPSIPTCTTLDMAEEQAVGEFNSFRILTAC